MCGKTSPHAVYKHLQTSRLKKPLPFMKYSELTSEPKCHKEVRAENQLCFNQPLITTICSMSFAPSWKQPIHYSPHCSMIHSTLTGRKHFIHIKAMKLTELKKPRSKPVPDLSHYKTSPSRFYFSHPQTLAHSPGTRPMKWQTWGLFYKRSRC